MCVCSSCEFFWDFYAILRKVVCVLREGEKLSVFFAKGLTKGVMLKEILVAGFCTQKGHVKMWTVHCAGHFFMVEFQIRIILFVCVWGGGKSVKHCNIMEQV